jgi:uncharacterized protein YgiB involved in biofilm formation
MIKEVQKVQGSSKGSKGFILRQAQYPCSKEFKKVQRVQDLEHFKPLICAAFDLKTKTNRYEKDRFTYNNFAGCFNSQCTAPACGTGWNSG